MRIRARGWNILLGITFLSAKHGYQIIGTISFIKPRQSMRLLIQLGSAIGGEPISIY